LAPAYFHALHVEVAGLSIAHWINDALMALFFLLVGLEVKREFLRGELSSWSSRILPGAAAIAGMAVPALIFVFVNRNAPEDLRGWAIPAATDIAFALGILALLGDRVPASLRVLLAAIAVIDDLLAIVVIALFYAGQIAAVPLCAALGGWMLLIMLNRLGVRHLAPYLLIGAAIWYGVFLSGVHATLAGVMVALTIPLRRAAGPGLRPKGRPPLERLEHAIQPWVAFLIVPIFGFANAGLSFGEISLADFTSPLPIGIAAGLFLGKQIGIFGSIWALVRMKLAALPDSASWRQIYGVAMLCGIGFTMSLFIGGLAFAEAAHAMDAVKLGVLSGSLIAGLGGWLILRSGTVGNAARV
jgi:NhaA family Na+:H+ antiporter